jgi:hypothetical protein
MPEFRCERCPYYENHYCLKLKHQLEHSLAMQSHGGLIGNYGRDGKVVYPARCGIRDTELELK